MVSRYNVILVVAGVVGVLSLAAVITLIVIWLTVLTPFQDYAVVVDAGSSHSTIFVYTWPADKSDGLGTTSKISQVKSCEAPGGSLSSISQATESGARQYFDSAMTLCLNSIPSTRRSRTLLFLGATAGLRLFNMTNPTYTSSLLNATRVYFSTLGLQFLAPDSQVRIISGAEEGLSGWISVNMLLGELFSNNKPLETYGAIDMGGASTQLSFIAPDATSERYRMNLFKTNYEVYSHSYLCYGQDQIRLIYKAKLIEQANGSVLINDPCLQTGYNETTLYGAINRTPCTVGQYQAPTNFTALTNVTFRGTGNYEQCRTLLRARLNKTQCSSSNNCSFNGVYQPIPISTALRFVAFSAVYSAFNTLAPYIPLASDSNANYNLAATNLTQILAAIATVCGQSWLSVLNATQYRPFLCFQTTYHWTLFEDGYSMNHANVRNFQIVKTINSNEIGWTLGYMINQTNYLTAEYRPPRLITQAEFIGILVCFVVLLVLSLVVIIITIIVRRQTPSSRE